MRRGSRVSMAWRALNGSAAVEYAIVLPLLLLLVLGLVDTGRILWSYITLSRAVAAASRCAAVNTVTCGTTASVQTYAASQAWGIDPAPVFTVTVATCGTQVTGTMNFAYITPWFYVAEPFGASNTLTLSATACYPV